MEPIQWSPGSAHGLGNACKSKGKKVKCKGRGTRSVLCWVGEEDETEDWADHPEKEKYEEHGDGVPDGARWLSSMDALCREPRICDLQLPPLMSVTNRFFIMAESDIGDTQLSGQ